MTPSLLGRIQTRIVLIATVGTLWTLFLALFIDDGMGSYGDRIRLLFTVLLITAAFGIVSESVWHFFQQFRWEKDWPMLWGLLQGLIEAVPIYFLASRLIDGVSPSTFALHFATTWFLVWLIASGPMRAVTPRWRYRGGRLL